MDDDSPRMISHKASQNLNETSTIHCKPLTKQAHSLVLKFHHHHRYFCVQPARAIFIFPASSPACFTGAELDIQGVWQITCPVLQKAAESGITAWYCANKHICPLAAWKSAGVGFKGWWWTGGRGRGAKKELETEPVWWMYLSGSQWVYGNCITYSH